MDLPPAAADYARLGLIEAAPTPFEDLPGFASDDLPAAWTAFLASCAQIAADAPGLRPAVAAFPALRPICAAALALGPVDAATARSFITSRFRAWRIRPSEGAARGFLTGYYEPEIAGSWTRTEAFGEPLYARPGDLAALRPGEARDGLPDELSGGRRRADGRLEAYPARAAIDIGGGHTQLLYVRDAVEAFMIHVQGSASIRIGDEIVPLTYTGRNGRPYTSIGRILIERGDVALPDMSLARLKQWVRDNGQRPGEKGRDLLWRNESFIFFAIDRSEARKTGPIGGAGTPLTPLRSIAIDRAIWPYGLFFWFDAALPWRGPWNEPFQRLMVAQDTGSAIVGPSRADLYVGAGDAAGAIAGNIRHPLDMYAFLPRDGAL